MPIIKTDTGIYSFEKQQFAIGGKKIDIELSKNNLLCFKRIMEGANVNFILAYGTLLGVIRENNFIAHDEDIDVIVLEEDRKKFLNILFHFKKVGFEVGRYENDLLSLTKNGEYIDIYFFRKGLIGYRKCGLEVTKEIFLLNTIKYDFLGVKFEIPENYLAYLEYNYGMDWKIPKVNSHALKPGIYLTIKNFIYKNNKTLFEVLSWLKSRLYA